MAVAFQALVAFSNHSNVRVDDIHSLEDFFRKSTRLQKILSEKEQQIIRGLIDGKRQETLLRVGLERENVLLTTKVNENTSRIEEMQEELLEKRKLREEMAQRTEKLLDIKEKQRKREVDKLERSITKLHQEIYEKSQNIEEKEKEVIVLREQLEKLKEENQILQEALSEHDHIYRQKSRLEEDIERVKVELDEKNTLLQKFVYPVQDSTQIPKGQDAVALKRVLTPRPKLEQEVNQLKIKLFEKEKELKFVNNELEKKEKEMSCLQQTNSELEEKVKELSKLYEEKASELAQMNEKQTKRFKKMQNEIKDLIKDASEEGVSLKVKQMKTLECNVLIFTNRYNTHQHELKRLYRKMKELEEQNNEFQNMTVSDQFQDIVNNLRVDNLEDKERLQASIDDLTEQLQKCATQLQRTKTRLELKLKEINNPEEQKFPKSILKGTPSTTRHTKHHTLDPDNSNLQLNNLGRSRSDMKLSTATFDGPQKQVRVSWPPIVPPKQHERKSSASSSNSSNSKKTGYPNISSFPVGLSLGLKEKPSKDKGVTGKRLFHLPPADGAGKNNREHRPNTTRLVCRGGMSAEHRGILRQRRTNIATVIDVRRILPYMLKEGVFTEVIQTQILNQENKYRQAELFLDFLASRSSNAFDVFCKALEIEYRVLGKELRNLADGK